MSSEAEPVRAELFQGKTRRDRDRGYGRIQLAGTPRRARWEATRSYRETQGAAGDAEKSRSCPRGGARGGGRAPRSSAAISCGVVTARVTRMGPLQREHTEMSTRKTRARSFIHGKREGAVSRS